MNKMNENDKNEMLDGVKDKSENYEAKMWGVLMATDGALLKKSLKYNVIIGGALGAGLAGASGALSNQYCYVGMSETGIYFVVIANMNVKKIKHVIKIPYDSIKKVKVKWGVIPGRKVINIHTEDGKLKLSLMNNAVGTDMQGQKEAVQYLCEHLESKVS